MSEEEKKELIDLLYTGNLSQYGKRKLVNYIEKQQKEIEELKEKNASLQKEIKLMKSININDNYTSKDKIREVIKKYYNDYEEQKIYRYTLDVEDEQSVLKDIEKELLEE